MAIGAYPRTTVQGTGNEQNTQSGYGLMIFNPATLKYEAATASTFAGGGGGDATAANQTTQINEAQITNQQLDLLNGGVKGILFIDSTATATGLSINKLVVNADCEFQDLIDSDATDLVTLYGLSGKTISKGMVIVTMGVPITDVEMVSGSVIAYLN
jgi:hypothetical protein